MGVIHYEGQTYFGSTSLKGQAVSNLYLGLYTNSSGILKEQGMADVAEVSGMGYSRQVLNMADWTEEITKTANDGTLFAQPRKTFLFDGAVGLVYGYFITTVDRIENPTVAPTLAVQADPDTATVLPAATYYVKYTWVNTDGETKASPSANIAVNSGEELVVTLPTLPAGVDSANIYISTTSGSETKQGSTATTSYTQSDALASGTALPSSNTTAASGKLITSEQFETVVDVNQIDFEIRITSKLEFV